MGREGQVVSLKARETQREREREREREIRAYYVCGGVTTL